MADLLTTLQRVLQDEREVFGDFLVLERPLSKKTDPVPGPESGDSPDLFGSERVAPSAPQDSWSGAASLSSLDAQINTCVQCPLGATRTKFVFGVGNPHASLMFVGEAPGADEDAQGEPFVGRAGQLLNKILEAITLRREDVYIANILKCRPPKNRTPVPEEVEQCLPYLRKQIELVKPRLIVCLGLTAAHTLLGTTESLGRLRGRIMAFAGIPMIVTYHPAALLRNPNWKRPAWEDFQAVQKFLTEHNGNDGTEGAQHG